MPDVEIRRAVASDIPILMAIDHSVQTDYVWQMEVDRETGRHGPCPDSLARERGHSRHSSTPPRKRSRLPARRA